MIHDGQVQAEVEAELNADPRLHPGQIGVAVEEGVVTLTGVVDSSPGKWAAERAAWRVEGVRAVAQDIEVRLPDDFERTDSDIARAVANVLDAHVWLHALGLHVRVEHGWVKLEGTVEWEYQRREAERLAHEVWGVKGVTNAIQLVYKRADPLVTRRAIEAALARSVLVGPRRVSVEVEDGKAVLRGEVRNWHEREEAMRAAWSAAGVTDVGDELMIRP